MLKKRIDNKLHLLRERQEQLPIMQEKLKKLQRKRDKLGE